MTEPRNLITDAIEEVARRIGGFAADMRAQGIHVGINGVCPVDGQDWPCPHERGLDDEETNR